jgi:cytidylate kinase
MYLKKTAGAQDSKRRLMTSKAPVFSLLSKRNQKSSEDVMSVITINGPVGSGAIEVGQLVAQQLSLNYVDRLVLAEAAKLVHAPVGALLDKEQLVNRFRDRLAYFLQTMLERSALYADAGEP